MHEERRGIIDCDVHPTIPSTRELLPFLDDYWRELTTMRGFDRTVLNLNSYPPTTPLAARRDWLPGTDRVAIGSGRSGGDAGMQRPGSDAAGMASQLLDPFGIDVAICNPLHGAALLHSEEYAAVFCSAVNQWIRKNFLDRDPRLRASITVPLDYPEGAVEEIERCSDDPRFVQVLLLASGAAPLGKRRYWPIYEAASRHGLQIGVHAGSAYRFPTSPIGWPSYYLEDYVNNAQAFESQLMSFVGEGVFTKFPDLKVIFIESGFMWLPSAMWRANKTWKGVRPEVPWIKELPSEIIRRHFRFTLQPVDEPPAPEQLSAVLEQLGSDELLLFSTDYPHWHFDGLDAVPGTIPAALTARMQWENALETYPRLKATLDMGVSA